MVLKNKRARQCYSQFYRLKFSFDFRLIHYGQLLSSLCKMATYIFPRMYHTNFELVAELITPLTLVCYLVTLWKTGEDTVHSEVKTPHPPDRPFSLGRPKGTNPTANVARHELMRCLSSDRNGGVHRPGLCAGTLHTMCFLFLVLCEGATASAALPNITGVHEPNTQFRSLCYSTSDNLHDYPVGARRTGK